MTQEVLQSARVHASVGQGVTGRMPQHVNVNRKRQLGGLTGALDHAGDPHSAERLRALVYENPSRVDATLGVAAL